MTYYGQYVKHYLQKKRKIFDKIESSVPDSDTLLI